MPQDARCARSRLRRSPTATSRGSSRRVGISACNRFPRLRRRQVEAAAQAADAVVARKEKPARRRLKAKVVLAAELRRRVRSVQAAAAEAVAAEAEARSVQRAAPR